MSQPSPAPGPSPSAVTAGESEIDSPGPDGPEAAVGGSIGAVTQSSESVFAGQRDAARAARPGGVVVGGKLVACLGLPWLRDLDFGTQFLNRCAGLEWPADVVVEDISYSAHRVLHLLEDLAPSKVVMVGAMPREIDPPGTIRRYLLDLTPPEEMEVHERLTEAIGGIIDLDHTLAVVRHWKAFPDDTVVIEIEPGDRSFGLGFSDEVEAAVGTVLNMIREEVGAAPVTSAI